MPSIPGKLRGLAVRLYDWFQSGGLTAVLLVAVAGLSVWGFFSIAEEVVEGDTLSADHRVLLSLRTADDPADPLGPDWLEEMARDVTALGSVAGLGVFTLVTLGHLWLTRQRGLALYVLVATLSGTVVSVLLKDQFDRPRPHLVPHETRVFTASFPSGHSAMSALFLLTLGTALASAQRRRSATVYMVSAAATLAALIGGQPRLPRRALADGRTRRVGVRRRLGRRRVVGPIACSADARPRNGRTTRNRKAPRPTRRTNPRWIELATPYGTPDDPGLVRDRRRPRRRAGPVPVRGQRDGGGPAGGGGREDAAVGGPLHHQPVRRGGERGGRLRGAGQFLGRRRS